MAGFRVNLDLQGVSGVPLPILVGGRIQRKSANFRVFQQKSAYFAT